VTYTPLQRLTRITIGGALQSLQFYHAYRLGVLISETKKNAEDFRDGYALLSSDRGGHILQPQVGLFKRLAELDFTSMYPSLMVYYNVSPEMLNCKCCKEDGNKVPGLDYHICIRRKGIVPLSLRVPLTKRIQYKQLARSTSGKEAHKYKKMDEALKWILVVCFGYLGFRNARFGRIEAHQTVCAYAREFLLNAKDIIEDRGMNAIHGIVDSLWVQAPDHMATEEFHNQCQEITQKIVEKTHIPISYDPNSDFFKFICFLPTKANPDIGALNRYWGFKSAGKIKVRGLELRRHDAPPFIKDFQLEAITCISQADEPNNFQKLLRNTLKPLLLDYYRRLEAHEVSAEELAITIRVTRSPDQYKVKNYQMIAASYLEQMGVSIGAGKKISFIITNDQASNPQDRVLPLEIYNLHNVDIFDVYKYKELLVRALTNLLPYPVSNDIKRALQNVSTVKRSGILVQKKLIF
jgi:DNA polymerase elongation subunit (family B)